MRAVANVLFEDATSLPSSTVLREMLPATVDALHPDVAYVTDEATLVDEDVLDRGELIDPREVPSALHWLTWLGPRMASHVDVSARRELGEHADVEERAGGLLITLQQDPTWGEKPADAARRHAAEAAMGLSELQRRFPSR